MLQPLRFSGDPNLLVGLHTSDDAAVYRLSDDLALVQTVDFFPPVVDDAYTYGAIAAANSMSDVFAMGGEVLLALNIAAFPDNLPLDILSRIFQGGADKAREAGIVIAGGHTVTDAEPKYGLVVTGTIHPDRILTKAGAQAGDRLFITKALGTGVITTAIKQEVASGEHAEAAIASMLQLNQAASRLAQAVGVHACTDVTGFGLLGHGSEVAIKSGVGLDIVAAQLPWLPGARAYGDDDRFPGGASRNREYYEHAPECGVTFADDLDEVTRQLLYSPETSGGLLLSVAAERGVGLLEAFAAGNHALWEIGAVREDAASTSAEADRNWRAQLDALGLTPSKGLGQNFLHDRGVVRRIVEIADLRPDVSVLEIGPGLGVLTRELAANAARVVAVEVDSRLAQHLRGLPREMWQSSKLTRCGSIRRRWSGRTMS